MIKRLRLWIGLFFCLLSVAFFLINSWPARRSLSQFDIADRGFIDTTGPSQNQLLANSDGTIALPARYSVALDLPANLRVGEPEPLRLTLQQKELLANSSPLAGMDVSVEGSILYPDLDFRPQGSIYLNLAVDHPAKFVWFLTGSETATEPGTLWLYLLFHNSQGSTPVRVLVLAHSLSFVNFTPLGIPGTGFQIAAWVSLAVGAYFLVWAGISGLAKKHSNA
ncbi:hypothetical protein [Longilinea arvoryzae]|nr:hypothetical protein [Longilinea arvoryzae]